MSRRLCLRATASVLALAATAAAGQLALAQDSTQPAPAGAGSTSPGSTGVAASQSTTAPGPTAPASAGAQTTSSPFTVDTIVVTAQKRKENLQDVPIVVNGDQQATAAGQRCAATSSDLQRVVPGLTVTSRTPPPATTTARIRGVGTVGDNPGLEPSVGIVIDGVYRPRNGVGFNDLGDVDQIEVLKGPQGTLFGKSTSAGVINIVTAEPHLQTFGGAAEFTAGNYNAIGGSAEVHGALPILGGDQVAGSFYFADRQRDGFQSVVTGAGPRTRGRRPGRELLHRPRASYSTSPTPTCRCGSSAITPIATNTAAWPWCTAKASRSAPRRTGTLNAQQLVAGARPAARAASLRRPTPTTASPMPTRTIPRTTSTKASRSRSTTRFPSCNGSA